MSLFLIIVTVPDEIHPCTPSPCGPNSQCREYNGQAICSCLPGFMGAPPTCRPECIVNSDCKQNEACFNRKCRDPCPGTCGTNAKCQVISHSPVCICLPGYTGDPFTRCHFIRKYFPQIRIRSCSRSKILMVIYFPAPELPPEPTNPCVPSPCGLNAQCQVRNQLPSCTCLPNFNGSPPNCRPECASNSECPSHLACINQKCKDPCPGACGTYALCHVISHTPMCTCQDGYVGNPMIQCTVQQSKYLHSQSKLVKILWINVGSNFRSTN